MTSSALPHVARRIAHNQRLAREGTCPKCRAPVLTGPSHDDVAMICTVNAEPIDPKWLTLAEAKGLATFDMDKGQLCYRDTWHRANVDLPIHVWHVCR